jgi:O-antigen/teichoic acid export membrane protein
MVYYKSDVLLLSSLSGNEAVGVYSAAYRVLDALMFLPAALMGALFPILSRLSADKNTNWPHILESAVRHLAILGIPAATGTIVISAAVTQLLYGNGWAESTEVLQILMLSWALVFINAPCGVLLNALGKPMLSFGVIAAGICVNVMLNLVFIPKWVAYGASWATVIAALIVTILYFYSTMRVIGKFKVLNYLVHPIIGSAIMYLVLAWQLAYMSIQPILLITPLLGVIIYVSYILIIGAYRWSELRALASILRAQKKGI